MIDCKAEGEPEGMFYECPLCRRGSYLSPMHLAILVKGSWSKMRETPHHAVTMGLPP